MANLRDISRRMGSIRNTMQVTRTMEMISTARIRAALERAEDAAPYKDALTRMLAAVAEAGGAENAKHPLLEVRADVRRVLYVVVASDRGLAGGFNVMPERMVERAIHENTAKGIESEVITCGKKPTEYFSARGVTPKMSFSGISAEPNMDEAARIASFVIDGYESDRLDRIELIWWHARSRVDQSLERDVLLPISAEHLRLPSDPRTRAAHVDIAPQGGVAQTTGMFEFDPSPEEVLGYLLPAYVRTVVFHALLDSAAAEHGARRRAMQSATDSAEEVLGQLSRTYNRVRQGSITTELNEIIGGASALEESK